MPIEIKILISIFVGLAILVLIATHYATWRKMLHYKRLAAEYKAKLDGPPQNEIWQALHGSLGLMADIADRVSKQDMARTSRHSPLLPHHHPRA